MRCEFPLSIKVKGQLHVVGCGHCLACKLQRSREWSFRLNCEAHYWKECSFLTLTYNDDNLPLDTSLHKDHLQKFFKRLRKDIETPIKYYACGEYGEKGGYVNSGLLKGQFIHRPHFHAIIFGLGLKKKLFQDNWPYGFIYVGSVTPNSIDYVTSYVQKKLYLKDAYGDRLPPFSVMSKGLGFRYAIENREALENADYLKYKGKPVSIPRYFFKKLDLQKYNTVPRLCTLSDKLCFDSKYILSNPYSTVAGSQLLKYSIYNDKRVLGGLHQLNLRLKESMKRRK